MEEGRPGDGIQPSQLRTRGAGGDGTAEAPGRDACCPMWRIPWSVSPAGRRREACAV